MRKIPMLGQTFGLLTVISECESTQYGVNYLCICRCGKTTVANGCQLRSGDHASCGCSRPNPPQKPRKKRQLPSTPGLCAKYGRSKVYKAWVSMKQRCSNPHVSKWKNYGGRGIKVCDRWLGVDGFAHFLQDMGEPSPNQSLDRIDVNGNYSPENCRWASKKEQLSNKRNSRKYTYKGETKTLSDWATSLGAPLGTLTDSLNRIRNGENTSGAFTWIG